MAKSGDYSGLERPYDAVMNRTPGGTSPVITDRSNMFNQPLAASSYVDPTVVGESSNNATYTGMQNTPTSTGAVETQPIASSGSMDDIWVRTFIRSSNWQPRATGFNIDGRTGQAEFMDVTVKGSITATSGSITGTLTIGAGTPHIVIDGVAATIGTSDFASGDIGWQIAADGTAEFNNASIRGALRTAVFQKDDIHATGGTFIVATAANLLHDFTSVTSPSTSNMDIEDPHSGHTQLFNVNDILRIKDSSSADNWLKVTAVTDNTTHYTYTVGKQSGSNLTFRAGTAVVDYAQSANGVITLTSDQANSPYIDIATNGSTPWSGVTSKVRIGNLAGITDAVFGSLSGYGIWTNSGYFSGSVFASAGYFGDNTNGIQINSTGVTVIGSGYLRTSSSNARLELRHTLNGGVFTNGFDGYDSGGNQVFRLAMDGGNPMLSLLGNGTITGMQITNSNSANSIDGLSVTAAGLENGVKVATSGSTSRSSKAAMFIDNSSTNGYGIYVKNGSSATGTALHLESANQTDDSNLATFITPLANHRQARVTVDAYAQFPAYHHCSDFDETISGSTVLASTVIAKAYWVGGGTSGTQTLISASPISDDLNSYIQLATTATGSRSSTLQFGRYVRITATGALEWRFLAGAITNTKINMGFFTDASNYIFLTFDTALNAAKFYIETKAAGTGTQTQTGSSIDTISWRTARIHYMTSKVFFYLDDSLLGSITTNIPTTNAYGYPYFYVDNKSASQNNTLNLDYVKIWTGRMD